MYFCRKGSSVIINIFTSYKPYFTGREGVQMFLLDRIENIRCSLVKMLIIIDNLEIFFLINANLTIDKKQKNAIGKYLKYFQRLV